MNVVHRIAVEEDEDESPDDSRRPRGKDPMLQMIIALRERPHTERELIERMRCSKNTVQRAVSRMREVGLVAFDGFDMGSTASRKPSRWKFV